MNYLKKKGSLLIIALTMLLFILPVQSIDAKKISTPAKSAIVVDFNTGKILYGKNIDTPLPPASMTKMMTEYIVLEKINNGEISWDTKVKISEKAFKISANNNFSGVGLRMDHDYTVKELYEGMAIYSDNATSISLAELISNDEGEFVKLMNEKAKELKLPEAKFVNSSGLDNGLLEGLHPKGTKADATNILSAESAALLAFHLISDYPEVLDTSSTAQSTFDGLTINNYNWMLPHESVNLKPYYYKGVDGLKTGHTDLAGYNFTSTAKKGDRRLITVVMNTESAEARFKETAKLLDYGFDDFVEKELFKAGYQSKKHTSIPVIKGKADSVNIATDSSISNLIEKGTEDDYSLKFKIDKDKLTEDGELIAPIKKGEKIGTAELRYKNKKEKYISGKPIQVDLVTIEEVEKKNWFKLTLDAIGQFFANSFDKVKKFF